MKWFGALAHHDQKMLTQNPNEPLHNFIRRIHLSSFVSRWACYTAQTAFRQLRDNLHNQIHKDRNWALDNNKLDWFFYAWGSYERDTRGQGGGDYDPW